MCHGDCRWDTATSTCTKKDSTKVTPGKNNEVDWTTEDPTGTPSGNYSGLYITISSFISSLLLLIFDFCGQKHDSIEQRDSKTQ